MTRGRSWRGAVLPFALLLALTLTTPAYALSSTDAQANNPQVQGDPTSNATALFPTNQQHTPTIAFNPIHPSRLVAGATDGQRQPPCGPGPVRGDVPASDCSLLPGIGRSGVYISSNAGRWTNRGLLDDQASWMAGRLVSGGDPVVMYGPTPDASAPGGFSYAGGARVYYLTRVSFKDASSNPPQHLAVSTSDDDGRTWTAPVLATPRIPPDSNDRAWLAVDTEPTSPFFGRVYVSWTGVSNQGGPTIRVSTSTDGGASFGAAKQVGASGRGPHVITGPDGNVYVAFERGAAQVVSISRDGGSTWAAPVTIGAVADIDDPLPGSNFRTNSFPTIADDPRPESMTLYSAWVHRTPDGGRVVVSTSGDRGLSWSAAEEISTGAEGYAFNPGLYVAPTGRVDVGYQAQQAVNPATFGTGNAFLNSWYTHKQPGGEWVAKFQVSNSASDPAATAQDDLARQLMGDDNQLVSTADVAWFVSTDARNGVGCPAVDQYQRGSREKPAPAEECGGQFGNSDVFVARIIP